MMLVVVLSRINLGAGTNAQKSLLSEYYCKSDEGYDEYEIMEGDECPQGYMKDKSAVVRVIENDVEAFGMSCCILE